MLYFWCGCCQKIEIYICDSIGFTFNSSLNSVLIESIFKILSKFKWIGDLFVSFFIVFRTESISWSVFYLDYLKLIWKFNIKIKGLFWLLEIEKKLSLYSIDRNWLLEWLNSTILEILLLNYLFSFIRGWKTIDKLLDIASIWVKECKQWIIVFFEILLIISSIEISIDQSSECSSKSYLHSFRLCIEEKGQNLTFDDIEFLISLKSHLICIGIYKGIFLL